MPKTTTSVQDIETTGRFHLPDTYQAHKRHSCEREWLAIERLYLQFPGNSSQSRAFRFRECRTWSWFARNIETGLVRVASSNCKLRWCPLCASAKANYISRNCEAWLKSHKQPKMLTLTLKHSSAPLKFQIDNLYESFRKLRKSKLLKEKVAGGIWFFQLKKSKSDSLWHPHLHCLISSEYLPQQLLSKLWYKITLTSNVVDIRSIKDNESASKEVARYCARPCKMSDLSEPDRGIVFEAFHGRRISGTWGNGSECKLSVKSDFDETQWEYLATWKTIQENVSFDDRAKAILHAYKNNTILAPGIHFRGIENKDQQVREAGIYDKEIEFMLNRHDWDPW